MQSVKPETEHENSQLPLKLQNIIEERNEQNRKYTMWNGKITLANPRKPRVSWVRQFENVVFCVGPDEYWTVSSYNDNNIHLLNLATGNKHVESYGSFTVMLRTLISIGVQHL